MPALLRCLAVLRRFAYPPRTIACRVRLVVRTQPSQGWCTGSTPVRGAIAWCWRIRSGSRGDLSRLGVVSFICLSLFSGCSRSRTYNVLAEPLEPPSQAFLSSEGTALPNERTPLTAKTNISPGQTLQTTEAGTAVVDLVPGIIIQLNPNTTLAVERLEMTKSSYVTFFLVDSRRAVVRLLRGSIYAFVAPTIGQSELEIHLADGQINAAQQTCFYLDASPDANRVVVAAGQLTLQTPPQREAFTIGEAQLFEWQSGANPAIGTAVAVDDDPAVESQTQTACENQRRFSDLLTDRANRLPTHAKP